jgi:golgin subfamily B member 1
MILFSQELELRIDTQKQTLSARDESIKKLLEMLQNKGIGKFFLREVFTLDHFYSNFLH